MILVVKLNNVKATPVDVEVDISCFKIRRDCFPDFYFGMKFLDFTPGFVSDTLAMAGRGYEQDIQISPVSISPKDHSTYYFAIRYYTICFAGLDRSLDRFAGDDLFIFFEMIVPTAEFLKSAIIKGFLIIQDELVSVLFFPSVDSKIRLFRFRSPVFLRLA